MIHCIGNSHVRAFSASNIAAHHIGPVIAYNFLEHHFFKIKGHLRLISNNDYVSLIAGEVDCRYHLPLQADTQGKTDIEVTTDCVDRFFRCFKILKDENYNLIAFATHPTTTEPHDMSDPTNKPIYSSCIRRNNICILWNRRLKELCDNEDIPFISIYEKLVDENNITKMEYFEDYCHLDGEKVKPLIEEALRDAHIKIV
jgi:hypothetical protein